MTTKSLSKYFHLIVPTLRVGMHPVTLRVTPSTANAPDETRLTPFRLATHKPLGHFLQKEGLFMN
jgi:hypothetical protein